MGRVQGRTYVVPDDIKMLAEPVLSHRLLLNAEAQFAGTTVEQVIDQILGDIAPPAERASALSQTLSRRELVSRPATNADSVCR